MRIRALFTLICFGITLTAFSQEVRSFDGTGNNTANPNWGAKGTQLLRLGPVTYGDGISTLAGLGFPNPRLISNTLFTQDTFIPDPYGHSDFIWVFGQFIDHDITFIPDGTENVFINIPQGDTFFDPWNTGQVKILFRRSQPAPGTGTGLNNPRQQFNNITAFIDASAVYGSDQSRADWLRSFSGGKLKVSAGDLLPYNTTDGQLGSSIDPGAPHMDNPVGATDKLFVAGDVRANEQPLLVVMHTLFVREHNRLCDVLAEANPGWTDEQLYQQARRLVSGMVQRITFEEWLPTLGVVLDPYTGYDPSVNPGISNEFSAAGFRLGHTMINEMVQRIDLNGNTIPEGNLVLKDGFFIPDVIQSIGLEPYCKGMAIQEMQQVDTRVIGSVRNFLFGPPGAGGLDLASINIGRGRERGILRLNGLRVALGLPAHTSFSDISSNPAFASTLQSLYSDPNNVELWVGLLAEDPLPNSVFGPTLHDLLQAQFASLRDGDRFYYKNDPALSQDDLDLIENTTMRDIVLRNTQIPVLQQEVFLAMPHEMLCQSNDPSVSITGFVQTESGDPVEGVDVQLFMTTQGLNMGTVTSDALGAFDMGQMMTCAGYMATPERDDDAENGVTTLDLVILQQHILGINPLTSPYKLIAADANRTGTITTTDMVEIRKVILHISQAFTNNTSWRFVDASYVFQDPTHPFNEDFPEVIPISNLQEAAELNFVGIKVGDLNNSVQPSSLAGGETGVRSDEQLVFEITDEMLSEGTVHEVAFRAKNIDRIAGFQFTLNYSLEDLELVGIRSNSLPDFSAQNFYHMPEAGAIAFSWNGDTEGLSADRALFTLQFRAKTSGPKVCQALTINSRYTKAEAYTRAYDPLETALLFHCMDGPMLVYNKFELYQNMPNPVQETTEIGFYLPEAGSARLQIFDESGRLLLTRQGDFPKGSNRLQVDRRELGRTTGVLYYQVESEQGKATRKMVLAGL
ncbi:MAG: T9SS type A sorting domain-containing protein [Lewinellaceae bacterium]|nr:T9SS type A sorting domain-containing protein [Lewinellaceae bacterium]